MRIPFLNIHLIIIIMKMLFLDIHLTSFCMRMPFIDIHLTGLYSESFLDDDGTFNVEK